MELWVKDKIKQLLALPETIKYIDDNNFHLIYSDAEQYEADPEIVGNLTYTLLKAGLDPLKLDVKLKDTIPYAYLASTKTKTFSLPKAIKTISGKAFERTSLDLFDCSANNQLENIDYHAFYACQKLKEVILPESLKYIGSECFRDCHHLEKINIPANCIFLGGGVFSNCYNLKELTYKGTKEQLVKNNLSPYLVGANFYIDKVNCVDGVFEIK